MKLGIAALVSVVMLTPAATGQMPTPDIHGHGILHAARFQPEDERHYLRNGQRDFADRTTNSGEAPRKSRQQLMSDRPRNLSKVAHEEEGVAEASELGRGQSSEFVRGVRLCLDTEENCGYVLARDYVPAHLIEDVFTVLAVLGWHPVEDDEAIEPHKFDDGTFGVQIWLYRMARPIVSILHDVKAA